eukprot:COSAG01_NODE_43708_length_427_cov_0.685976_1_plen_106_part_01
MRRSWQPLKDSIRRRGSAATAGGTRLIGLPSRNSVRMVGGSTAGRVLLEELIEHADIHTSGDHGGGSADTTVLPATTTMRATVRGLAARALLPVMAQRPTFVQALQ